MFPAGAARAEDPGRSAAKEAAEAVPAESVHLERNDLENGMFLDSLKAFRKANGFFEPLFDIKLKYVLLFEFPFFVYPFSKCHMVVLVDEDNSR